MGSSAWCYREPLLVSLEESFWSVQQRVLDSGEFLWKDDLHNVYGGVRQDSRYGESFARPVTLEELAAAKRQGDEFWATGTHSILDMHAVAEPTLTQGATPVLEFGVLYPLRDEEVRRLLGHVPPTADDLDVLSSPEGRSRLNALVGPSWTGRYLVSTAGPGAEDEVLFWGFSGD